MADAEESEGQLSIGWCQTLVSGKQGSDESYLQVLSVNTNKPLPIVTLHDGRDCMEVIISTQAKSGLVGVTKGSVIQADQDHYKPAVVGAKNVALFTKLVCVQPECEILPPAVDAAPAPFYGVNKLDQTAAPGATRAAPAPSPLFGNNRKPSKASPFMSNPVKRKIAGGAAGAKSFTPIAQLNPYTGNWTIKGRCTEKSDVRKWNNARGEGTLFNFTLMDSTGDIRVTAFKKEVEKWCSVVQEGEVFTLTKGRVKFDNYQKKNAITMGHDSELVLCSADKGSFVKVTYDFKSFAEIEKMEIDDSGPKKRVDTFCIVKSVGELQKFTAKNDKEYTKRDVMCVDKSGIEMSVTMWGKNAEKYTPEELHPGTVLILPQVSVSTFGGRSMSAQKVIQKFDDYPEVMSMREWWENGGKNSEFKAVSADATIRKRETTNFAIARREKKGMPPDGITYEESQKFGGDWITVTGFINMIVLNQERAPWYLSEPEGKKKVTKLEGGGGYVTHTGATIQDYNCRWLLRFKFADYTQSEWCSCFDREGNQIMGQTAKEMESLFKTDFPKAERVFRDRQFSEWTASILCKQDTYNDQTRVRYQVNGIQEVDYVKDTERMMSEISDWAGVDFKEQVVAAES